MRVALGRVVVTAALVGLLAAGCGPGISETRMGYHPPNPATCEITVINSGQSDMAKWAMGGEYEMVGMIGLGEVGHADPFSDDYMKLVRPRACRMGGDAITLMASSQTSGGFMAPSGTSTSFLVLRRHSAASTPAAKSVPQPR